MSDKNLNYPLNLSAYLTLIMTAPIKNSTVNPDVIYGFACKFTIPIQYDGTTASSELCPCCVVCRFKSDQEAF